MYLLLINLLLKTQLQSTPEERGWLPLEAEAYAVTQEGEMWRVTVKHSGEVLYAGPGPVVLVESPAPF